MMHCAITVPRTVLRASARVGAPFSRIHVAKFATPGRPRPAFVVHAADEDTYSDPEEEVGDEEEGDEFDEWEEDDPSLRLYLDSADPSQWEKWAETGLFYGLTTNPTILKRDGVQCTLRAMRNLARHAFDLDAEELQLQAWGATWNDIYSCGLDLYELESRIVVKVPVTPAGIRAAHRLLMDDVPVTLTGVHSTHQVVTAMSLGAFYVAPDLGRMNDAGKDGIAEISKMQEIIDMSSTMQGETRLLVASIRSADEIGVLAANGCNTFTISPAVADQLLNDPLTMAAAEVFEQHAAEMGALRDE